MDFLGLDVFNDRWWVEATASGLSAAPGCTPQPMDKRADRWDLPRNMFNRDWKSDTELESVLRANS